MPILWGSEEAEPSVPPPNKAPTNWGRVLLFTIFGVIGIAAFLVWLGNSQSYGEK